ncbi:fatty acid desaturase [Sorangium sp. So ce385]|uniref:fatty acid desaturase n=1 Tax=Sorangium sp. So ce385 TaxID=3133308 RepID=UPI003F5C7B27
MSVQQLRQQLSPYRHRTLGSALLRMGLSLSAYGAAFYGAITASSLLAGLACGLVAGLFSGNLFMIGHDACHGSYTRLPTWNRVLGRIAFLPSYHPYSVWDLSHNRTHHAYTNLKGKDFVWTPLSKAEFDALPRLRRALYRAYRTPLGLSLYYPLEIWRERLFFPRREHLDRPRRVYTLDCLLVLSMMLAQLAAILWAGAAGAPGRPAWLGWLSGAAFGVVVPWLAFGWLIGFVVYFNHTHPSVIWYDRRDAWSLAEATVRGTVHLRFPAWTRPFASNIMAHLAHHIDPRIPLVRLKEAQERLEELLPGRVVVQAWSVKELRRILRVCRLYDYDARRWTDYDGRPTSERARFHDGCHETGREAGG